MLCKITSLVANEVEEEKPVEGADGVMLWR